MVCLKAPEPHIRVLWGAQFVTLSFAQPTSEDGKVLDFARDIRFGLLLETVVVKPEWLTPGEVTVPPIRRYGGPNVTPRPQAPSTTPGYPKTRHSLSIPDIPGPLSMVHPLMVFPFLAPATAWHMMQAKYDAMGMT